MPISKKDFEDGKFTGMRMGMQKDLLDFLQKEKDKAFTVNELPQVMKARKGTIGVALIALKKKGLIRHASPYWIYKEEKGE